MFPCRDEFLGGEEVLIEFAGKDSTEAFDDVGHSQDAKDILKQYHIGTIVESERAATLKKAKEAKK
jgi:cytochrome b5